MSCAVSGLAGLSMGPARLAAIAMNSTDTKVRDPETLREVEAAICVQALRLQSTREQSERRAAWRRLQELRAIASGLGR